VTSVIAFAAGLPYGALGVAVAYAISEYLRTPFLWLYVGRTGPLRASHVLHAATPFVLGAHLALALVWLAKPMLPAQPVVALAGAATLSYAVTIIVALGFSAGREAFKEVLKLMPARRLSPAPSEAK